LETRYANRSPGEKEKYFVPLAQMLVYSTSTRKYDMGIYLKHGFPKHTWMGISELFLHQWKVTLLQERCCKNYEVTISVGDEMAQAAMAMQVGKHQQTLLTASQEPLLGDQGAPGNQQCTCAFCTMLRLQHGELPLCFFCFLSRNLRNILVKDSVITK
jgi:hypothetical protein